MNGRYDVIQVGSVGRVIIQKKGKAYFVIRASIFPSTSVEEESTKRDSVKRKDTYCGSSTRLGNTGLIQIMRCLVEVLGRLIRTLFVLLEVGDGDVGLLSCVDG